MSNMDCLLQCGKIKNNQITFLKNWDKLKEYSSMWKGLDKFGNVYDSVDWEKGPSGHWVHNSCKITISSITKNLMKAQARKQKELEQNVQEDVVASHSTKEEPAPKRLRSNTGTIHDKNKCIWCIKPDDKKHKKILRLIITDNAWTVFKSHTVILNNQEMRDRINCLIDYVGDEYVAAEIRYHIPCWNKYIYPYQKLTDDQNIPQLHNVRMREAQTIFMNHVRSVIFKEHELRSLQNLLGDYKQILSRYGFSLDGIKSSYVKEILMKEFKESIGFQARPQRNVSELVYDKSAGGSYIEAAITSMGVSDEQLVSNLMKRLIEEVKAVGTVPWPPSVDELAEKENLSPLLLRFVSSLRGKPNIDLSPKVVSLTSFLTQFILGKPTKTSINSTITIHGITRSKEIVDNNDKLGLGISYSNVLYLRDFWALQDLQTAESCPVEIAEGKPGISIVDNDDFLNDTLTGGGTSHRTNWMMIQKQELANPLVPTREEDTRAINKRDVSIALSHKASEMQEVRPYKTLKRGEPPVREKPNNVNKSTESQRKRSIIHALTRINAEGVRPVPSEQKIPSFNGFQATLHAKQDKSKAYYHKSYDQPPNKAVINDIMQKQVNIIQEKQMPFAFLVGDLPVYILIMELKGEHPEKYKSIIPFLGPFHTQCVMMTAMFKRYEGSELEEVLVQAGIVAAGSVNQALNGKHFRRGLRCIRLFYEALISKLLIDNPPNLTAETKEKLSILRDTSKDQETRAAAHESLMEEEEIRKIVSNILAFCNNEETDMANYWKDFLEMADALLQSVHAVHTVDFSEYINAVRAMLPWMLAYDKQRYGRWLPDFWAMVLNLPADQFLFLKENFAQSITGNPYSNMAWCMWIETTMNKGSKLKSGWLSILKNEKQVLVHSRNVNNIARIRTIHNAAAKRKSSNWKHTECNPKRLKLDEEGLQNILGCLEEYGAYPFDLDNQILRTMQSGVPASPELVSDLKSSNEDGEKGLKEILNERVYSKKRSLHAKMKKMNRKTFTTASLAKDTKDKKMKIAEMEQAALKSVLDLVEKSNVINLEQILENRVTEESTCLFNADGSYRKSVKSQLLKKMQINSKVIEDEYTAIVDMGMMWRLAMPATDEKSPDTDENYKWRDYGHNVSNTILARHRNATKIICVNDVYDSTYSTKDDERILREKGLGNIPNEHYKPDGNFPSRTKFNKILRKPDNKIRLQKFILKALKEKVVQSEKIMIYSTGKKCEDIATGAEMETLQFDHNEADTIMLSMYTKLRDDGFNGTVVLDAADTDVYVAAAYISNQCSGELFIKRGSDNVNCKSLVNDSMVNCIIPLHTMTGCDANSGFYGKGKGMLFDKVNSSDRAKQQLQHCGLDKEIDEKELQELMSFTRELVYGDFHSKSMGESRALKWRSQKKKSFCRLPPDEDSMRYHIKRANYLAYLLRNPSLRDHPSPIEKGWELVNRICRPLRHCKPPLPDHLSANDPDHLSEHDSDGNSRNEQDSRNNGDSDDDEYDGDSETDSESGNSDNEFDDIDYSTEEEYSDIE